MTWWEKIQRVISCLGTLREVVKKKPGYFTVRLTVRGGGGVQSLTRVSISKNLEKKWLLIFSLARENWIFISLFSFMIIEEKKYFSSRCVRFLKPFSFYSWFPRFLRKNLFLLLIDEILKHNFFSSSLFWEKLSFSSRFMKF